MPITKTGRELCKQAIEWSNLMEKANRFNSRILMPGLTTLFAADAITSGKQSVGEALGEAGGGFHGFDIGSRLVGKVVRKPYLHGLASFVGGLAGSAVGGSIGSAMGGTILPFRRG